MGPTPRVKGDAMAELVPECRRSGARAMGLVSRFMYFLMVYAAFLVSAALQEVWPAPNPRVFFFSIMRSTLGLGLFLLFGVSLTAMVPPFPSVVSYFRPLMCRAHPDASLLISQ